MEQLIEEICGLACALSGGLRVSVSCYDYQSEKIEIVSFHNGPTRTRPIKYALPKIGPKHTVMLVPDVRLEPALQEHPIFEIFPNLRSIAAYWLGTFEGKDHFLIIWNPTQKFFESDSQKLAMDHIVSILIEAFARSYDAVAKMETENAPQELSEPAVAIPQGGAATRFLIDTLIKKQRLLARKGASYVALRQWRKTIKPYQISALTALKADSDENFEDEIAAEMVFEIRRVYGDAFAYVIPIPGGSSGKKENLSAKLAKRVAKKLGAKFADVLVPSPVKIGSSHPAKSMKLKPYKVNGKIDGNVLIVDDVATTGTHIELATNAIRPLATFCTSVVWIAD